MEDLSPLSASHDVIGFLKEQHKQIKSLFEDVISQSGSERLNSFAHLKRLMTAHEAAEEKVVHPTAEATLPGGRAEVAARTQEEIAAKRILAELALLDVASPEFDAKIRALQTAVLAHAQAEENEELDRLRKQLDEPTLKKMADEVARAEAAASQVHRPS